MKIAAIGSMPLDLELACFGTLSRLVKDRHSVHIIIAKDKGDWRQEYIEILRNVSRKVGVLQTFFTERFDYSEVTQDNVSMLGSYLKVIDPSLVIMPFWKSSNWKRKILAKTSLIACRGIPNVLMYELGRNTRFLPTVYFTISADEISLKASSLARYGNFAREPVVNRKVNFFNFDLLTMRKRKVPLLPQSSTPITQHDYNHDLATATIQNAENSGTGLITAIEGQRETKQSSNRLYPEQGSPDAFVEVFESHRTLLVDQEGLF